MIISHITWELPSSKCCFELKLVWIALWYYSNFFNQAQKSRHAQLHVDAEKHADVLGDCVLFANIGCVFVMQKFHWDCMDVITYQSTPNIISSNFMEDISSFQEVKNANQNHSIAHYITFTNKYPIIVKFLNS